MIYLNNLSCNDFSSSNLLTTEEMNVVVGGSTQPMEETTLESVIDQISKSINPPSPPEPVIYQPPYLGPEFAVALPPWVAQ